MIRQQISFMIYFFAATVFVATSTNFSEESCSNDIQECANNYDTSRSSVPAVPPGGMFQFDDDLWDTSKGNVDMEKVRRIMGCPKVEEFRTFEDNSHGYFRIPTEENTWRHMYEAYHAAVPPHEASIPKQYDPTAFVQPIEIQVAAIVGRGIRTTEFIPKGTLVWRPRNAAEFRRVEDLRKFLEHIMTYSTYEVACDALLWSYTSRASPKENDYILCIDMDEGSLINVADDDDELNLAQILERIDDKERTVYGCQTGSLYATRDIKAGEELRMDYGDFAEADGFGVLGIDMTEQPF
ncbi:SET methyltransferase domain containing protein [Nitzschia inconspicua]|uniref:SET methyltransferase domain containing protein n=1 Tax=Nitzschia inconspicua TaxID=303405 RepID=A0A9K3PLI7_9STRA|nr:SET methyltransferase domain containing protein [Nitzschia inconspicua]